MSWFDLPTSWFDEETLLRVGLFLGLLAALATWEELAPRRGRTAGRRARWPGNLGLALVDAALVRVLVPLGAIGIAREAAARGWGLLNQLEVPLWLAAAGSILALDFAIYLQHVLFHRVPALWRVHKVHHSDPDADATTGVRFHPVEIVVSMAIKMAVVVAAGAPAAGVLLFEVLLNATSLFNHANLRLPDGADRVLRWVVVTPDMHRVHHSSDVAETNSNFGFNLPWWDRLLGTYRADPALGHARMRIGVAGIDPARAGRLDALLWLPFGRAGAGQDDHRRSLVVGR